MPKPALSPEIRRQIESAPHDESDGAIAVRLGCGERSVRRYRAAARREDEETARVERARHVAQHTGDALADLAEARRLAGEEARADPAPARLRTWLDAIRLELDQVGPDRASDEEVLARAREVLALHPSEGSHALPQDQTPHYIE